MFNQPLPTDNLYKFLALFGLVLFILFIILQIRAIEAVDTEREVFLQRLRDVERDTEDITVHAFYLPRIPLQEPEPSTHGDIDSDEYHQYFRKVIEYSRKYHLVVAHITATADKAKFFSDDDVRKEVKSVKGFNDAEYRDWIASLSTVQFQELTRPVEALANKMGKDVNSLDTEVTHYYKLVRRQNDICLLSYCCIAVSTVLMVVGFALWYYRVQRYQDTLLQKEAAKKT